MKASIEYGRLTPVDVMAGEDDEETSLLRESLEEARAYLKGQKWCRSIRSERFGLGVGGVVAVFLFELAGDPGVDDLLWVVSGDLPLAYLVTDSAPTPAAALELYCDMMEDWINAARGKAALGDVFPVAVHPTEENAARLEKRVAFLRSEVIPAFR